MKDEIQKSGVSIFDYSRSGFKFISLNFPVRNAAFELGAFNIDIL